MKTLIDRIGFEIEGEWRESLISRLEGFGTFHGDGTIRRCCDDKTVAELSSTPYKQLRSLEKILDIISEDASKFHYNFTCGFHVHVSFTPKRPPEIIWEGFTKKLRLALQTTFPAEYARRAKNRYCTVRRFTNEKILETVSRYYFVNILPALSKHGTIEFRFFPAATPERMKDYLRFLIDFIEKHLEEVNKEVIQGDVEGYTDEKISTLVSLKPEIVII